MQVVRRQVEIQAPIEAVLSLTLDAERYPEFAPSIQKAELLRHDPQNRKYVIRYTSTIPVINKTTVSEQEICYDLNNTVFYFRETQGSFGRFEGFRRLHSLAPNRSAIESEVRYSFGGSKLMASLINNAARSLVQSNLEHIQEGIRCLAEAGQAEPLGRVLARLRITPQMLVAHGMTAAELERYGILPASA